MNMRSTRFQMALMLACLMHVVLAVLLMLEPSSARPVLVEETQNEMGEVQGKDQAMAKQPEIVHAVSVDEAQVQETMNKIKNQRLAAKQAEEAHQAAAQQALKKAQEARLAEQQRLANMKLEEEKIAIARKKALEKEKQHIKQLTEEKAKQLKALAALKQKQAVLKQQQVAKEASEAAAHQKAAQAQAQEDAAKRARLAGVVDKYKAMILNAIGRQWILPDNVAMGLSSQFKIRLAPNGDVLEVVLSRSSGDPILDRSAQVAIHKASPLPVPADPASFEVFREITLTVRPEQMRG